MFHTWLFGILVSISPHTNTFICTPFKCMRWYRNRPWQSSTEMYVIPEQTARSNYEHHKKSEMNRKKTFFVFYMALSFKWKLISLIDAKIALADLTISSTVSHGTSYWFWAKTNKKILQSFVSRVDLSFDLIYIWNFLKIKKKNVEKKHFENRCRRHLPKTIETERLLCSCYSNETIWHFHLWWMHKGKQSGHSQYGMSKSQSDASWHKTNKLKQEDEVDHFFCFFFDFCHKLEVMFVRHTEVNNYVDGIRIARTVWCNNDLHSSNQRQHLMNQSGGSSSHDGAIAFQLLKMKLSICASITLCACIQTSHMHCITFFVHWFEATANT